MIGNVPCPLDLTETTVLPIDEQRSWPYRTACGGLNRLTEVTQSDKLPQPQLCFAGTLEMCTLILDKPVYMFVSTAS